MALLAGVVLFVGPWVVRNDIQLGGLTLSTNSGPTLAGAYNPATFSPASPWYGSFSQATQVVLAVTTLKLEKPPGHAKAWSEFPFYGALGNAGKTYASQHLNDLPGVVLAREGRIWGVYSIGTQLVMDTEDGGQVPDFFVAGRFVEWIALPMTLAGGIILGRISRRHLLILVVPILVAALDAAVFYGSTRLRVVAEPSMFLLSSVALVAAFRWIRTWTRDRAISMHQVGG
jgi:hypothetical protein